MLVNVDFGRGPSVGLRFVGDLQPRGTNPRAVAELAHVDDRGWRGPRLVLCLA